MEKETKIITDSSRIKLLENFRNKGTHTKEERVKLLDDLGLSNNETIKHVLELYPDFLTCPASVKFHGAYEGGLFDHSLAVYESVLRLSPIMKVNLICVPAIIFHDLCKVDKYKEVNGKYVYDNDVVQLHHGPESLRRLFMCDVYLPEAWQFAVAYHMGAFGGDDDYGTVCGKYPEVLLLHTADMMASKLYKI